MATIRLLREGDGGEGEQRGDDGDTGHGVLLGMEIGGVIFEEAGGDGKPRGGSRRGNGRAPAQAPAATSAAPSS